MRNVFETVANSIDFKNISSVSIQQMPHPLQVEPSQQVVALNEAGASSGVQSPRRVQLGTLTGIGVRMRYMVQQAVCRRSSPQRSESDVQVDTQRAVYGGRTFLKL
jgi:hypothetical protein